MATIRSVERQIRRVEGFDVAIRHLVGNRNVRGDRQGLPGYRYERRAKDAMSVRHWIETRFKPSYPGFDVDALWPNEEVAHGGTLLSTVREAYAERAARR